ncbi:PDZ domain-containing protein [Heliobacillus mobilis]|uniref:PDZ domain-containing protein n=1 Tax=Heliobacterium mobile TaxID=28064 RepID=A0A6I3SKY5_HELMO|nr:S41 family peptidase [Heliobacterium mobile]MTV49628.1 PDZ domain-containing protein [Heliobacterium mobile]
MAGRRRGLVIAAALVIIVSVLTTASLAVAVIGNYQHLGRLINVVRLVTSEYLEPTSFSTLVDGAMKGMVASLKDPYSTYLEPDEYKQLFDQIQGSFSGIGVYVSKKDQNKIVVVSPIKGGPAERVGIKAGDVIVKVDGEEVANMDVDLAVSKIKGPEGSNVNLTVFRENTKNFLEFTVPREKVNIPVVTAELAKGDNRIGVLRITQFNKTAAAEVDKAIRAFQDQHVKGIILDLRDNPGGELESAVDIASNFVPQGPVVKVVNRDGETEVYQSTRNQVMLPLAVLINGGSASASEIVAGAIKDYGTGTMIGSKSFGKGIVQSVIPLDGGAAVKLTTAKYLTPKGNDIHKIGIEPDFKVEPEKNETPHVTGAEDNDSVFNKGVEVVRSLMR